MTTPDTAEAKIREILENYPVDEATQLLKGLLVDARIDELDRIALAVGLDKPRSKYVMQKYLKIDYLIGRRAALQQTRQEEVRG